jgi:DNA-binding transcriptional MerR regulator
MDDLVFSHPQLCEAAGISKRQAIYWTKVGILTPSVNQATGSGYHHKYSYSDVLVAMAIKAFLDAGFELQRVKDIRRVLLDQEPSAISSAYLCVSSNGIVMESDASTIRDKLKAVNSACSVLAVGDLVKRLNQHVLEFRSHGKEINSSN